MSISDTAIKTASPVTHYRFGRHDKISVNDNAYRWDRTDDRGHLLRREDDSNLAVWFSHAEMQEFMRVDKLVVQRDWYRAAKVATRGRQGQFLLSELPADEQHRVLWKQEYCDRFLKMEASERRIFRSDASMRTAIAHIAGEITELETVRQKSSGRCGSKVTLLSPPSPATLRGWLRRYEAAEYDPTSLRDAYGRSGNRVPRIEAETLQLAKTHADGYADSRRPTKVMLFKKFEEVLKAENESRFADGRPILREISRRTFEKLIDRLDPYHVCAAREGAEVARRKFGIVQGGLDIKRPLERIEVDEWNVSLQVLLVNAGLWAILTPDQKAAVGRTRVWLSAAIDAATRCVLALRLLNAAPSSASSLACLEMVVSDKSFLAQVVGTLAPWDMCGTPEIMAMDSGSAFIAAETKAAISDLGSETFYPPSGMAEMRARIERLFGNFQQHFVKYFAGQTFENFLRKGEYDSCGNACVDIEELNRTLIRFVVDAYHNTPHSELAGETPRNAWYRLSAKYGVLPPPDAAKRRHIFGIPCGRRIQNKGIRTFGLHYQSLELQQLRRMVGQKPILVRVDRLNLGEISVRTPDGWMVVKHVLKDVELSGVSYWEWIAAVEDLRLRNADISRLSVDVVNKALSAIRGTTEMAIQRAELGSPILGGSDADRLDRNLFRTFAIADASIEDEDVEDYLGSLEEEDGVTDANPPMVPDQVHSDSSLKSDDQFGAEDDWLTEE